MKYAISPVSTTWTDFDRAFRDLTQGFFQPDARKVHGELSPRVEVYENEDYYGVSFDLPGFDKENINVQVDGDQLIVSGERKRKVTEGAEGRSFYTEKTYGAFTRTLQLPKDAGQDEVTAEFQNGVLDLKLKKTTNGQARKIEIQS